jgi:hypothetical protein
MKNGKRKSVCTCKLDDCDRETVKLSVKALNNQVEKD